MFSSNFQNLLVPSNETTQVLGNAREIGKGLRINSSKGAELDISWSVGQSADHEAFGRNGRFLDCEIDDIENSTRKTFSFRDSGQLDDTQDNHFLCVAQADAPTKVLVTVAYRTRGENFVDLSRTQQAIGVEPTALMVTVPASSIEAPSTEKCDYRFNITTKRPGKIAIQVLDVRHCAT